MARNAKTDRVVRRSEHPTMSGNQVIGYHFICECGHSEPDYIADEHDYCPNCGGRYADTITTTTTTNEQGDNMDMRIQEYDSEKFAIKPYANERFEVCLDMLVKGYVWAVSNYTTEISVIADAYPNDKTFTGRVWTAIHSLRMLDAILSQRVLDGKMEMEELEDVRTHSISHAFEFVKYVIRDGDCEWGDFFLPATMELEAQYEASNSRKTAIMELVDCGWECVRGTLSMEVPDTFTIAEYKAAKKSAIEVLEKVGFGISDDSSISCITLDLILDNDFPNIYVEDGHYFSTDEEYEKFLHETDV